MMMMVTALIAAVKVTPKWMTRFGTIATNTVTAHALIAGVQDCGKTNGYFDI